jgi:hypothetical protein
LKPYLIPGGTNQIGSIEVVATGGKKNMYIRYFCIVLAVVISISVSSLHAQENKQLPGFSKTEAVEKIGKRVRTVCNHVEYREIYRFGPYFLKDDGTPEERPQIKDTIRSLLVPLQGTIKSADRQSNGYYLIVDWDRQPGKNYIFKSVLSLEDYRCMQEESSK